MHDVGFVAPSAGETADQFSSSSDKTQALSKIYIFKNFRRVVSSVITGTFSIKVQSNLTLYFNNILKS